MKTKFTEHTENPLNSTLKYVHNIHLYEFINKHRK